MVKNTQLETHKTIEWRWQSMFINKVANLALCKKNIDHNKRLTYSKNTKLLFYCWDSRMCSQCKIMTRLLLMGAEGGKMCMALEWKIWYIINMLLDRLWHSKASKSNLQLWYLCTCLKRVYFVLYTTYIPTSVALVAAPCKSKETKRAMMLERFLPHLLHTIYLKRIV